MLARGCPAKASAGSVSQWATAVLSALVVLGLSEGAWAIPSAPAAAERSEPAPPGAVARKAGGASLSVYPGLPAVLKLSWRNTSQKSVEVPTECPAAVTVEKAGGAAQRFWVIPAAGSTVRTATLAPGQVVTRSMLLAAGRKAGGDPAAWEWLFPAPGRYSVVVEGFAADAPVVVTVDEPAAADDKACRLLWTPEVGACLAGDMGKVKEVLPLIEKTYTAYPASRYAAYALWAKANYLARFGSGRRDLDEAGHWCEIILDRHAGAAMPDVVLDLLVTTLQASRQGGRAREAAEELARAAPESESLARLRRAYGGDFSRLFPVATPAIPSALASQAALNLSGLDQVPDGPRQAFDAWWQAQAQGRLDAMRGLAARDFMGDEGDRTTYLDALARARARAAGAAIQVVVKSARIVDMYHRPMSIPAGDERTWHGPICLVEGSLSVRPVGGRPGPAGADVPRATWALYQHPQGTWKLVSEMCVNRHLAASALAQKVARELPQTLTTWKISDGQRERFPYEEIKQQAGVAGRVADDRSEWKSHTVVMVGEGRDQAQLTGQVRMLVRPGAAGKDEWVERRVTIFLALDATDVLVMRSVAVNDLAPVPAHGPGPVPRPPAK